MAAPQTLVSNKSFEASFDGDIPADLAIRAVSEIRISFPPTFSSSAKDRSGSANHAIRDPNPQPTLAPVTVTCHGNKDQTQAVYNVFKKAWEGDPLRSSFTGTIKNLLDGKSDIVTINMFELTLLSYDPFGQASVERPDVLKFKFTFLPARCELKV